MYVKVKEEFDRKGVSKGFTVTVKQPDGTIVKVKNAHGIGKVIQLLKKLKETND